MRQGRASPGRDERFWDRVALRYSRKPVPDEGIYRRKLEITRRYLRPDMKMLEFACGTGTTAIIHAPYVGSVHAIDISTRMLAIARRKAQAKSADNIRFDHASIESIRLPAGQLDVVMGHSILHLLEDWQGCIRRMYRALRPGGIFVTSTPCIGERARIFRIILPLARRFGLAPRVRFFTRPELTASMREAGFEIEYEWQPGSREAVFMIARRVR